MKVLVIKPIKSRWFEDSGCTDERANRAKQHLHAAGWGTPVPSQRRSAAAGRRSRPAAGRTLPQRQPGGAGGSF